MSSDIIDSIDNALTDYAVGPDAMRWTTDKSPSANTDVQAAVILAMQDMGRAFTRIAQTLAPIAQTIALMLSLCPLGPEEHHA